MIYPHDRLDGQGPELFDNHCPVLQGAGDRVRQECIEWQVADVIGYVLRGPFKPEIRHSGQNLTFTRNGVGKHHVKGRQAIGGDDQQMVLSSLVDIANFSRPSKGSGRSLSYMA